MHSMQLFIGIDAGGTWTKGAICDPSGSVLAVAAAGSAHPDVVGLDTAARHVRDVLDDLADRTRHIDGSVAGICVSGTTQAVCDLARWNHQLSSAPTMRTGDALAAFRSAPTVAERGVVVVLGTGSAAERSDGSRTVGGWGWMLGDEGGEARLPATLRGGEAGRGGAGKPPAPRSAC